VLGHFRFRVISSRVRSSIGSSIRLFWVSGCVGSGIESSSVGLFWVLDRIRSGRVRYQIIQCQIILNFESYRVQISRTSFSVRGWIPSPLDVLNNFQKEVISL
jgi:hypothetical protein